MVEFTDDELRELREFDRDIEEHFDGLYDWEIAASEKRDLIAIKLRGEDPAEYAQKLENRRNRSKLAYHKDPERNKQAAMTWHKKHRERTNELQLIRQRAAAEMKIERKIREARKAYDDDQSLKNLVTLELLRSRMTKFEFAEGCGINRSTLSTMLKGARVSKTTENKIRNYIETELRP